MIFGNRRAL